MGGFALLAFGVFGMMSCATMAEEQGANKEKATNTTDTNTKCKPTYTQVYQPPLKLGGSGRVIMVPSGGKCENPPSNSAVLVNGLPVNWKKSKKCDFAGSHYIFRDELSSRYDNFSPPLINKICSKEAWLLITSNIGQKEINCLGEVDVFMRRQKIDGYHSRASLSNTRFGSATINMHNETIVYRGNFQIYNNLKGEVEIPFSCTFEASRIRPIKRIIDLAGVNHD